MLQRASLKLGDGYLSIRDNYAAGHLPKNKASIGSTNENK